MNDIVLTLIDNNDIDTLCKRIVINTCGFTAHEIEAALDIIQEIFPKTSKVVEAQTQDAGGAHARGSAAPSAVCVPDARRRGQCQRDVLR